MDTRIPGSPKKTLPTTCAASAAYPKCRAPDESGHRFRCSYSAGPASGDRQRISLCRPAERSAVENAQSESAISLETEPYEPHYGVRRSVLPRPGLAVAGFQEK